MSGDASSDGGQTVTAPDPDGGNIVDWILEHKSDESFVAVLTIVGVLLLPMLLIDVLRIVSQIVGVQLNAFIGVPKLILIFGIMTVGYNILLGNTGLLSFGHAAMFGVAAYTAALVSNAVSPSPLLVLLAGAVVGTLIAWPIGFLSIRRSGVYFAVLTLTFGQMLYFYSFGPGADVITTATGPFTNGDNGYSPFAGMVEAPKILGTVPLDMRLPFLTPMYVGSSPTLKYILVAACAVLAVVVAHRIIKSPYGLILQAIGQNETRVSFVGLNAFRYKLMAFIISGAFASVGGGLYALYKAGLIIHPNGILYWTISGDFVIMTTLGGVGTLFGPIIGAAAFEYIRLVISGVTLFGISFSQMWTLMLGLAFVLVIVFFPSGIYGGLRSIAHRIAVRLSAHPPEVHNDETPIIEEPGGDDD